ncbi:MAG: M42 family metallopeptidase [Thaumarchaeota archaeon]|nr:M42 family metallopeptidase [Nitrososphaerota archaeon]
MTVDADSFALLKSLSESFGPSGFERETASIVKEAGKKYSDEVSFDKLGSVVFKKRGKSDSPRILLAGHMDEVGFVVSGIEKESGYLTFSPLGGWFDQVLLGHRVTVRTKKGDVTGIIASKPPHLLSADERDKVVKLDSMFIDIGATSKEVAEKEFGVRIGDPVAPLSEFIEVKGKTVVMGKAFDDRIGTFVGLEVLKRLRVEKVQHPNTVFVAGTVQEEVGLRGAQTVANLISPDVAIALEVDIAGDVPGIRPQEAPTRMGKGVSILMFDTSMIPNQALKAFVIETAEKERIPHQLSMVKGGTDAGRFHMNATGCPSIVLGVPTRHIHSHSAVADLSDVDSAIRLVVALIKRLDAKTVESFTRL